MKAAIYARVSTANNGQSPEMQLRELREYIDHRDWAIAGEYVDAGVSGSKDSRPELNRFMADAKQRRFDIVLVWKLDRFGHSLRHLVNALAELEALGAESDNLGAIHGFPGPSQLLPLGARVAEASPYPLSNQAAL